MKGIAEKIHERRSSVNIQTTANWFSVNFYVFLWNWIKNSQENWHFPSFVHVSKWESSTFVLCIINILTFNIFNLYFRSIHNKSKIWIPIKLIISEKYKQKRSDNTNGNDCHNEKFTLNNSSKSSKERIERKVKC